MNKILFYAGLAVFVFIIYSFFKGMKYFKNAYKKELAEVLTKDEYKVKGKFE